ncbi:MAG: YCF48-related protein [Pseudomonadota bacterium]
MVFALLGSAAQAQDDESLPAEIKPLAARSLLLDVHRTTEGRLIAVGERGHVVSSSDGDEWTQAENVPTRSTLTAISGSGNDLWAAGHDTVILHSDDGGMNWTLQYQDVVRAQPIMDLHFVDASTGYAIGAYGLLMKTNDGGESWDEFPVSPDEWHLNGIVDLGGGALVIAGEAGFSYVSEDAGENWLPIEMPYPGSMFGAVLAGDCIVAYGLRGNVQRSCDGGNGWEEVSTPTESSLAGGAYRDGETLLVGNSGQLVMIDANGQVNAQQHPSGVDFSAVVPLEGGQWLLVGEGGRYHYPSRYPDRGEG